MTEEETGASPTWYPGAVDHLGPLLLVGGDFNVITVGALVTVPQQQPEQGEDVKEQFTLFTSFEPNGLHKVPIRFNIDSIRDISVTIPILSWYERDSRERMLYIVQGTLTCRNNKHINVEY